MPNKFKVRTRAFLSRFVPAEHVPPVFNNNVHDLARIGGVSVLSLPNEYTPCDLVIPTRFAATAQFLVDVGMESDDLHVGKLIFEEGWRRWSTQLTTKGAGFNIPGLFRIPGSKVTTERLRAYFERQMYDGGGTLGNINRHNQEIEYTVRLGTLPNQSVMPYQVHDVASCFKSFLADLGGGLLGSIEIFEGLRKVVLPQRTPRKSSESAGLEWKCVGVTGGDSEEEQINPRHIARILCSIPCAASRNLILAVFGLLAFFMADDSSLEYLYHREPSSGIPILDEMRESCFPTVPNDVRMTAESLGRIFAPLLLGEELTKQVRMDFKKRTESKTQRRTSWTPSPLKRNTPSPGKRAVGRVRQRTSFGSNNTNITVNVHPHPLHSQPYLPIEPHEEAFNLDGSIALSRAELLEREYGPGLHGPRGGELSAQSFVRAHANCSTPNLMAATNRSSGKKSEKKESKASKSLAVLHDQQARILLIANVIALILWNWRDVCLELRAVGYGKGEGRWYIETSDTDGTMRVRNEGSSFEGRGGTIADV